jgi:hypothetical protein
MNRLKSTANKQALSPWLDQTKPNLFRDELRLIDDLEIDPWLHEAGSYFKPIELYCWIHQHKGEELFFKGLTRLAPMFPVVAYHGQVAVWISPPPSGLGNAIYLVMGHDRNGQLRLVGGNHFTEPARQSGSPVSSEAFFALYDQASQHDQSQLIEDTVQASIQPHDKGLLLDIRRECEHFHTMAIYITVLTDSGSLFHAGKAVIEGVRPADFSYEYLGEIK